MNAEYKVKREEPLAVAIKRYRAGWGIYRTSIAVTHMGLGTSERAAWADAWRRVQQRNSGKKE